MPLWSELLVALLIVYGAVVALAMAWFERRARLNRLRSQRLARSKTASGKAMKEEEDEHG